MSAVSWLTSLFSSRERALTHYRAGMAKANKNDWHGAIADYSACLRSPGSSNDVLAMALYNRALAYSAINEDEKAAQDLTAVLKVPGLPDKIKIAASQRQERIRRRDLGGANS